MSSSRGIGTPIGGMLGLIICLAAISLPAQNAPPSSPGSKPGPGTTSPTKPAGPALPGNVREIKPEVYHMRDKDGKLVPVPDFSYEDFKRLYDLDQRLAQATAPPAYVLQAVNITGKASDELAELDIRVRWLIKSPNWVKIPLRLAGGVLREVPTYDGPGEHLVEAEPGGGFIAWVRETDATPHALTIRLQVPVRRQGDESQFALPTPVATVSDLKLTVRGVRLAAQASGGSLLANETISANSSRLEAAGLAENFQLSWRPRDLGTARLIGAIEATSQIDVRVEGPRRVQAEARMKLRGVSTALNSLRVRLPAGMEFVPSVDQGYSAEVVEAQGGESAGTAAQVVELRWEQRTTTTADVRLRAILPATAKTAANEPIELAGFEVLGAIRQSGTIDISVEGDWSLNFGERVNVLPVELPDMARQQGVVARYEFHRQPCSLTARIQSHKSRVQVEPTYLITVGPAQVRLQANVTCRMRGPALSRLQLDFGTWNVDRVEPERLMGVTLPTTDAPGIVTIPLAGDTGAVPRDVELQVFAHLDPVPGQPLNLPIPRPLTDGPSSAIIIVAPEDNVSLAPRPAEMSGLVPEPLPPTSNLPARLQPPLYYRARIDTDPKRFVADWRLRPRATTVALRHELRIEADELRTEHRLKYTVANEPAAQVTVMLRHAASETPAPQFELARGGEMALPLPAQLIDSAGGGSAWLVSLPNPLVGEFDVVARLARPLPLANEGVPPELEVPLVVPDPRDEATISSNELKVAADPPWRVEVAPREWHLVTGDAEPGTLRYVGGETTSAAQLRIGRGTAGQAVLWLQNCWIQTWLARNVRHDRGVWKLLAYANHVQVRLPEGTLTDETLAAVDGVRTDTDLVGAGIVQIPLPADGREHVVEVSCFVPRRLTKGASSRLELPRLLASNSAPHFLWQVVTPRDEHLLGTPGELTPEMAWRWRSGYFERQGIWSQTELERWVGAATQDELPRETNQYLFSAIGTVDAVELRVIPRVLLVIGASATVLATGLMFVYLRLLQHPVALTLAGIGLVGTAVVAPETAIAIAQAAILGWALAILARVLHGSTSQRRAQVLVRTSRSSIQRKLPDRSDSRKLLAAEAPATTATAGPALPASAVPK